MVAADVAGGFGSSSVVLPRVSFPPSASFRCLSSCFVEPGRPVPSARRQLAWVSLQGRLVCAAEVTSACAVGKGLDPAEAAAWELFTPLHRVLLVALIAISSAESGRSRKISQLQRSVDIRDDVLRNMQKKLDELCEQMSLMKNGSFSCENEMPQANEAKLCHCACRDMHLNPDGDTVPLCRSQSTRTKDAYVTEPSKEGSQDPENVYEQEERRMSDLSDFCWSVASSVDFQSVQLKTLATEQELYNLRKDCEEKDETIKELTAAADASSVTYSKRIAELEEVIRRKNMVITKLKKDMVVIEQQVIKFTRLRRQSSSSSSSSSSSESSTQRLPLMTENILYDMSSSSPSSSDCDSPDRNKVNHSCIAKTNDYVLINAHTDRQALAKHPGFSHRSANLLKENCVTKKAEQNSSPRRRQPVSPTADYKKIQNRALQDKKNMMNLQKKWV